MELPAEAQGKDASSLLSWMASEQQAFHTHIQAGVASFAETGETPASAFSKGAGEAAITGRAAAAQGLLEGTPEAWTLSLPAACRLCPEAPTAPRLPRVSFCAGKRGKGEKREKKQRAKRMPSGVRRPPILPPDFLPNKLRRPQSCTARPAGLSRTASSCQLLPPIPPVHT